MYNEFFFLYLVCIFWWWFIESLSGFPQDSQNIQTDTNSSQQSMGSQKVGRDWTTEMTELNTASFWASIFIKWVCGA